MATRVSVCLCGLCRASLYTVRLLLFVLPVVLNDSVCVDMIVVTMKMWKVGKTSRKQHQIQKQKLKWPYTCATPLNVGLNVVQAQWQLCCINFCVVMIRKEEYKERKKSNQPTTTTKSAPHTIICDHGIPTRSKHLQFISHKRCYKDVTRKQRYVQVHSNIQCRWIGRIRVNICTHMKSVGKIVRRD